MDYWFDLDQTLCKTEGNDYFNSQPIQSRIDKVNMLFDEGNRITIWTGRGTHSNKDWEEFTKKQLSTWGLRYHYLHITEKPSYLIDNIAVSPESFFNDYQQDNVGILATLISKLAHNGAKVLICGNGGLDAESQHFKTELIGKFAFDTFIPCIALDGNTAIANDMGFENVFAHQIKVLGRPDDIFIGMTTSHSRNIVRALEVARQKGLVTVVICSDKYTEFVSDYIFALEGKDTAEIQENALRFLHKVAYKSKEKMVGEK